MVKAKKNIKKYSKIVKKKILKNPIKKTAQHKVKGFTKKDIKFYKSLIIKRKEEILDTIKHIADTTLRKSQKEASGDISGYSYHMADAATDTYDREFSLSLASSEQDALYEIEDALKRIEEKTFGLCEVCHGQIAKIRLKVVPYARLCLKCQEAKEKS
ncbi:MAG: TraR/DksA C4-type zinc finger protein [Candidatus Omnitrophota bacterium]